jgi:hypothetical protein
MLRTLPFLLTLLFVLGLPLRAEDHNEKEAAKKPKVTGHEKKAEPTLSPGKAATNPASSSKATTKAAPAAVKKVEAQAEPAKSTKKTGVAPRAQAASVPRPARKARPARGCPSTPLVIVTCGNAFASCSSEDEVGLMEAALHGISVQVVAHNYAGGKYPAPVNAMIQTLRSAQCGNRPIILAGRSAGGWAAAMGGLIGANDGLNVAGIVSYFGPMDLATLWQQNEWGARTSPRGPINLLMPWGFPGCDNCNNPFPQGNAFYYNVNDPNDPENSPYMIQALHASPIYYLNAESPPMFLTQGTDDGIVGQYRGQPQASRMYYAAGARPEDKLVICFGFAHGYNYANKCDTVDFREWFVQTINQWNFNH